jgi:hypothetical protein
VYLFLRFVGCVPLAEAGLTLTTHKEEEVNLSNIEKKFDVSRASQGNDPRSKEIVVLSPLKVNCDGPAQKIHRAREVVSTIQRRATLKFSLG